MTTPLSDFLCIGHRGAMGYEPENTLASFARALEMGCTWLELDVHLCEGVLVVIHDERLDRTTSGSGNVGAVTLDYLRSVDAGNGERVPFLDEVLDLAQGRAVVNVELKGASTAVPVSEMLRERCKRDSTFDQFLLSSFDHEELARADPAFRRGALFSHRSRRQSPEDRVRMAVDLDAWSINLDLRLTGERDVAAAHDAGMKVLVYTVNETPDIRRMLDLGVDGVFTNFPDRVFEVL